MKGMNWSKAIIYILCGSVIMMLAQSCSSSKKCGCGADLNGNYRKSRVINR